MPKYIELEKALEFLQHKYENMYGCNPSFYAGYQFTLENLKRIKSADVVPMVHGRWNGYTTSAFYGTDDFGEPIYRDATFYCCSKCGRKSAIKENFCPKCGAKMDL